MAVLPLFMACDKSSSDMGKEELLLQVHCNEMMGSVLVKPEHDLFRKGEKVVLTASPADGFAFLRWQSGSTVLASDAELEFIIVSDTLLTALFALDNPAGDDNLPEYTVEVDWNANGGEVNVSPESGPYKQGTILTLEAVPNNGWRFKGWEGLTFSANPQQLIVDRDMEIEALFERIPVGSASDLEMEVVGVFQLDDGFWDFEISLTDASEKVENIDDAEIKVAGFKASKDDFFDGLYKVEGLNLSPGTEIAVVLKHSWVGERTYTLKIPPVFSENDNLQYSLNEGVLHLDWEELDCDAYKFYRKIDSSSGSVVVDAWPLLTDSQLSVTEHEIYNSNVSLSMVPPVYFSVWICPVNLLDSLEGLDSDSRIILVGRRGTRLSNKP